MITLSDLKINCSKRVEREGMLMANTASCQRQSRESAAGWGELISKLPMVGSTEKNCYDDNFIGCIDKLFEKG